AKFAPTSRQQGDEPPGSNDDPPNTATGGSYGSSVLLQASQIMSMGRSTSKRATSKESILGSTSSQHLSASSRTSSHGAGGLAGATTQLAH
ncbi:unnamed protein product, partial [Amoebophrya sp. A25]